jgi:hypothetical protein
LQHAAFLGVRCAELALRGRDLRFEPVLSRFVL